MPRVREASNVVSLSGGKDSTAMLLKMIEDGEGILDIVHFDGGWEFPQMHDHLSKLEEYIGKSITRLRPHHSFTYAMTEHPVRARNGDIKQYGRGWPGILRRWCTRMKHEAMTVYQRSLTYRAPLPIVACIGFAADENLRASRHKMSAKNTTKHIVTRFPMLEWGMTEADALQYCQQRGFNWGGLYDVFDRVSCFCCPLGGKARARKIRDHFPDLWMRMLEMEKSGPDGIYRRYAGKSSVSDIDAEVRCHLFAR